MLDNDGITYNQPKRPVIPVNNRQSERALISVDRSQKLDLLIHLLTNLQQSLIVCGPEGIGKTTLLKTLESSQQDIWPICILPGSAALSFESVINQLSRFLNLSNASVTFDLSSLRAFCEKQKVVLAIDDAGELMPGLMGELMDFADSLAGLRLIFAMSSDDLSARSGSDSAINACHFIELPPLNQRQCLEFLQNLCAQPGAPLPLSAIDDALVDDLYWRTGGIPGRLLAELPKVQNYQSKQHWKLGLGIGLTGIVLAAVAFNWWQTGGVSETPVVAEPKEYSALPVEVEANSPPETPVAIDENITPAHELLPGTVLSDNLSLMVETPSASGATVVAANPVSETEENAEISTIAAASAEVESAVPEPEVIPQPTPAPATEDETNVVTAAPQDNAIVPKQPAKKTTESKPAAITAPTAISEPAAANVGVETATNNPDKDWILAQPPNNYTVQVMVLSSKASVARFMRKYSSYGESLKSYPIGKAGQEKYVIIYGSFSSSIEALNTKSDMPAEFANGLVKRFKYVQRESRRK